MQTSRLESLTEIEAAVWRELVACVHDKQHAWRMPVLATTDGEFGDGRIVVLREVAPEQKRLLIYTDQRSAKVGQLAAHPLGTLVMWSPSLGWQLRCRVALSLDTTGLSVASRWAQIKLSPAALDYLSPLPPGTELAEPAAAQPPDTQSLGHFAVMDAQIQSVDWLELHPNGQRRAIFGHNGARWVQP